MSTRSPKDGAKIKDQSTSEKTKQTPEEHLKSKNSTLKVKNGQEVVQLLSKSQRIFADITNFFLYRCLGTASGSLNVIVRPWLENLPFDKEFRCYVNNGKLTCISQVNFS